jgi:hypothetical protein
LEVSGQLYTLAALPLGTESPVPIGQEAEWASEPNNPEYWKESVFWQFLHKLNLDVSKFPFLN